MLKAKNRINKKKEIDEFFGKSFKLKKGLSASDPFFVIKVLRGDKTNFRLGIIINTKVDNRAVVRNRLKRQIREIFKEKITTLAGFDVLVVVQPKAKTLEFDQIKGNLETLLKRIVK